ncbi:MAG: ABC transporter permease [Planctomycetes bacterium]|nr:ABC transporter permease [Planctomycetota bacterium]
MLRWLVLRILVMSLTLLGVTLVTFVVLDSAPVDRAEIEAMRGAQDNPFADPSSRDEAVWQLRVHYGMVDAATRQPVPLWRRYAAWLGSAARLRFAGPNEDHAAFWRRFADTVPVTAWLGGLALLVAFGLGLPLGAWCGMRVGTRGDRFFARATFVLAGVPEFLLAMLLVLALAGRRRIFPASGLRSDGAGEWSLLAQVADFAWHMVLPVTVMAILPAVLVVRFVRDSIARAVHQPFALSLRALGTEPHRLRRRLLRNALAPAATLAGSLLPMLVAGSIVVENMFSLDGVGHLAFTAVLRQDQAMVMAIVVLTSGATLVSLLLSDLLHRAVDPRVRLVK